MGVLHCSALQGVVNDLIVVNRSPTVMFDTLKKMSRELIISFSVQCPVNKIQGPTWKNKKIRTYF